MSRHRKRARRQSTTLQNVTTKPTRRHATVYDAVARRVGYESFISNATYGNTRDTKTSSNQATYPEEVLFRRKRAPERYEETDDYFANEKLDNNNDHQSLPDSDLLKSIHAYSSAFYSRAVPLQGQLDWRSMDETALIALGILLEEVISHGIGESGDLAFTEADDTAQTLSGSIVWDGKIVRRSVIDKGSKGKEKRST